MVIDWPTFLIGLPFGFLGSYLALRRRTWQGGLATYVGFIGIGVVVVLVLETV